MGPSIASVFLAVTSIWEEKTSDVGSISCRFILGPASYLDAVAWELGSSTLIDLAVVSPGRRDAADLRLGEGAAGGHRRRSRP
jgi:hypothetical protein